MRDLAELEAGSTPSDRREFHPRVHRFTSFGQRAFAGRYFLGLEEQTLRTILLLAISNIFMTIAWYGHLKFRNTPLWKVILVSWGIAFFEYSF